MDGLWDPPNYQATEDTDPFSLAYDVLEDTALNEKSCIQVLQILISKADTNIIELEEELMDLLSQLACTDEVFSDMLSMTLRAKIDFLDSSIRKSKDDAGGFLSTGREPAESLQDILKSLFCHYLQKKDLQVCAENPSEQNRQAGSCSDANQIEKSEGAIITPVEKHTASKIRVKIEEGHTNYLRTSPVPKCSALSLCWGSTKKMNREVSNFRIKSPIMAKDFIQNRSPRKNSIQKLSLETRNNLNHQLQIVKYQPEVESIDSACIPWTEEPSEKQNIIQELALPPGYSNPQDHQELSAPLSVSRYSTRVYKRQQKSNSPMHTRSTSLLALEGPKPVNSLALVVASPLNISETHSTMAMDYYTVDELKAIAKERKIRGYYKLRKAELAELLGIKIIEGRRKQKRKVKRNETLLVPKIQGPP